MHQAIPVEDQRHETFWRQLLRWLVSDVSSRADVVATGDGAVNEGIPLRVVVSDSDYARSNGASVSAEVVSPGGERTQLPFEWATDRDGEYVAMMVPRDHGFTLMHQRGSHLIYRRQLPAGDSATVPVPNRREIPVGTLKSIINLSGLDESLFRK
jgi:predicted RNA binding protein YcfA (HicA-like mRNA interferase family)